MNKHELKWFIIILIIFLAACIETDIYLPAFPDMITFFGVSESRIQQLLSWNFIGICLSGPLYGPISDTLGRRFPLLSALGLFLFGSLITIFVFDFELMLVGRFLQGLGAGGCFTLGSTVLFDVFRPKRAIAMTNNLNVILPVIMASAPLFGAYLNAVYGFRANFIVIVILVGISLLATFIFLPESLPLDKRQDFSLKKIKNSFLHALTCWPFIRLTIVVGLLFAGYLAFLSGIAVLFVVELGVSEKVFPYYQVFLLLSFVMASLLANSSIQRFGINNVKIFGLSLCVIGGMIFVIACLLKPNDPLWLTPGMILYSYGAGNLIGPCFGEAMEILPEIKGVTASLITSFRLLAAAVVVNVSSSYYDGTIMPLCYTVSLCIVIILGLLIVHHYSEVNRDTYQIGTQENEL